MRKLPQREEHLIDGPAGALEVVCEIPQAADEGTAVAVICHPHPAHGGAMTNKVVHTLARAFSACEVIAVRFNFRGVGNSHGIYDEGRGELEDALSVIDWATARWPGQLSLAGFSFGAAIAMRAALQRQAQFMISVAPPVGRILSPDEATPTLPWLIVQGGMDDLVDPDAVIEWVNQLSPGPEFCLLEEADHFFHGELITLREQLTSFIAERVA